MEVLIPSIRSKSQNMEYPDGIFYLRDGES